MWTLTGRGASRCGLLAALILQVCLGRLPLAEAQADPVDKLLEQAQALHAKGRMDQAAEAFQKVLRSRPGHPEALEALGVWHANAGRTHAARQLLTALQRAAPGSPGAARLQAALSVGKNFKGLVDKARKAVKAGRLPQATALYEQAFGGADPPDRMALEYYQTLGGTPSGWVRARQGLAAYTARHPRDLEAKLALSQHLTYQEDTRREGIGGLQALSERPRVRKQALSAWRKALLWLHAGPSDLARFRTYLAEVGQDAEVQARLARISNRRATGQRGGTVAAGFEALERKDVEEATRQFERAGSAPEALTGLALVAMRKEDFGLAVELLEQAKQRAPKRTELWEKPLASARFWLRVKRAERLAEDGEIAAAENLLREAKALSADEAHHASIALSSVLRRTGRLPEAETELRSVLRVRPDNVEVQRALVDVQVEMGDFEGALQTNMKLGKQDPDKAWPKGDLEAEILRERARQHRAQGELREAHELLQEAVARAPKRYWVRHDLAGIELELGAIDGARLQLERLLSLDAQEPAGRLLRARLENEQGNYDVGLEVLSSLPPDAADGEVQRLRMVLQLRKSVERVVRNSGHTGEKAAAREMRKLQRDAAGNPAWMAIVALGYADIGQTERGVRLLQDAIARQSEPDPGLSLQLAAIYLRSGRDRELRNLLQELVIEPELSPRGRRDLARLRIAYAVSHADRLAEAGEYRRAFALLEPLLAEFPSDAALLCGFGRLFLATGETAEAAATFDQVLARKPDRIEAREGAISAAQLNGDGVRARELVSEGLSRRPKHARMHLIAARYELSQNNDDASAMRHLIEARTLAEDPAADGARAHRKGRSGMVPSGTAGLLARARARFSGGDALPAAEGKALVDTIDEEVARIRQRHSVSLEAEPGLRYRAGEPGLGQLTELHLPLSLSVPLGYFGKLEVGASLVWLTAGAAPLDNVDVAVRFGGLGSVPATAGQRAQDALGIAPHAAFVFKDVLRIEVGATPLGFLYQSLVGSVALTPRWGSVGLHLHGEREAVTDSLLSYAGTTDPLSGTLWGGVTAQGGGLDLSIGDPELFVYLGGAFHMILGREVADNYRISGNAGASFLLYDWDEHQVRIGVGAFAQGYEKDLSYFTFGHGGYFSPQVFVRGGVPLNWRMSSRRLSTLLEVDPGVNWFLRDGGDYYPTDAALQNAIEDLGLTSAYDSDVNFGFSLNLRGDLRYEVSGNLDAGLMGSMHFANDYEEYRLGAYLELNFRRRVRRAP